MLLTNQDHNLAGMRKRTINREMKIGPISLQFITVIILAAAALFYLAQSTASATRSYHQTELQQKRAALQAENEKLKVEAIRLRSLNEIKKGAENSNMETVGEIEE